MKISGSAVRPAHEARLFKSDFDVRRSFKTGSGHHSLIVVTN